MAFIVVGGLVGVRLLLLARRTRQLPEFAIGLGFVFVALVGYPLGLASALLSGSAANFAFGAGNVASAIGSISIFVFTWRVFRPDAVWASLLSFACMGLLAVAAGIAVHAAWVAPAGERPVDSFLIVRQLTVGVSYVWTALESLHWWRLSKKRLVLGLAEPLVANRFLLWSLAGWSAGGAIVLSTVRFLQVANPVGDPFSMLVIGMGGFGAAITIYLAFVPPAAYRRYIEAHAPSAA